MKYILIIARAPGNPSYDQYDLEKLVRRETKAENVAFVEVEIKPRRPYWDDKPDGYMESDDDFFRNNYPEIRKILAAIDGATEQS